MGKNMAKRNYLIALVVLTVILGVGGAVVLDYGYPGSYFSAYPFIPAYFFLFGYIEILIFERICRNTKNRTLMLYAFMRMTKLMVSVVVVIIFGVLFKDQIKNFLITFLVFYIVYMIVEVLFFFSFEKKPDKEESKQVK